MTTISIAMATYNGERFIRRQLDSFARQTLLPSELIVCDDGSTDSTIAIVRDFSQSSPFPVFVFNNSTRLGYTANFLLAAQKCHGDLIAFSDQDDEWFPEKLARVLEASRESEAVLVAHAVEWMDENDKPMGIVYPTDRRFRKFLQNNDYSGHAILIKRSLLEMGASSLSPDEYKKVAGNVEFGHDVLLLEIANALDKVHFIPEVLMRWRAYSDDEHAWIQLLQTPPHAKTSIWKRIFPPDLADAYLAGEGHYRKHSILLSRMLRDIAAYEGDTTVAHDRLTKKMDLMTKRAEVMRLRASYYGRLSRKARIKLMLQGAAMGQYRKAAKGGVGIHNALRDILACIVYPSVPSDDKLS
ncbi:MAG: glycosyltransferase [Terracidiphilus sp.]